MEILLSDVEVIAFGLDEAKQTARIRAELERQGSPIGSYDYQIAGAVMVHDAVLVIHNLKEFPRVDGLSVVDWF